MWEECSLPALAGKCEMQRAWKRWLGVLCKGKVSNQYVTRWDVPGQGDSGVDGQWTISKWIYEKKSSELKFF